MDSKQISEFRDRLIEWFHENRRDLPWRQTSDPYKIWVAETMLQQTQVSKVIPYYNRFILRFPTVQALAKAPLSKVLKAWENLGYYARARNLHKAARQIVRHGNGEFPGEMQTIRALPGIGPYTAAAILSIAFGQDYALVDGNVIRVLTRITRYGGNPRDSQGKKHLARMAEDFLARGQAGDYNQAVMELGATVCVPTNPHCQECPVAHLCQANLHAEQHLYPVRTPVKKRPHYVIAAGIILQGDRILIARRPDDGLLGGLWEFPGGKVEDGETPEQAVLREVKEELDVIVRVEKLFTTIKHQYTHFTITLNAFLCQYVSGQPRAIGCTDWRWVKKEELANYAFPRANGKIIEQLLTATD